MSSFRSRSGGRRRQTPLRRKYSSRRKLPASTSDSRLPAVEEMKRTEGCSLASRFSPSGRREGGTIDLFETRLGLWRKPMDQLGVGVFAGTAFSHDQNGDVRAGNLACHII